jgi:hypothetical protein
MALSQGWGNRLVGCWAVDDQTRTAVVGSRDKSCLTTSLLELWLRDWTNEVINSLAERCDERDELMWYQVTYAFQLLSMIK